MFFNHCDKFDIGSRKCRFFVNGTSCLHEFSDDRLGVELGEMPLSQPGSAFPRRHPGQENEMSATRNLLMKDEWDS